MGQVRVKLLPPYKIMADPPPGTRIIILIGGRGSAKTRSASAVITFSATIRKKRCAVLRDEKASIEESILAEILSRFDEADDQRLLSRFYKRLKNGIQSRSTKKMMVFTKGFKASQKSKTANMKSIADVDIAAIEEMEDLRDPSKFDTFADGIRKEGALIIMILNTPDIDHWIIKRYFNTEFVEDGYFKIVPKQLPGVIQIFTTYKDNPHLPQFKVDEYEAYNDPNSPTYNPHHYKTAIKGLASAGRKGQIHKKIRPIKLADYFELPFPELYGQDFGTSAPAGTIGCKIYKNTSWCRQLNYLPRSTLSLAKLYIGLGFTINDRIVADNADQEAIKKLRKGYSIEELSEEDYKNFPALVRGFNMIDSKKGPDSVKYGIDLMDGLSLFAVEESFDLWAEIQNRIYFQNKSGEYTNDPAPGFDHLIDPWMYCLVEMFGKERGKKNGLKGKTGYFR